MRKACAFLAGLIMLSIAPVAAAETEPAAHTVALRPALDGRPRLLLLHWPQKGWSMQQYQRHVEVIFGGENFEVDHSSIDAGAFAGLIDSVSSERHPDRTILRLTLACDCTLALHGDGKKSLFIDIVGPSQPAAVRTASGPAPDWAPLPPVKPDPAATKTAEGTRPGTLDVAAARERLLQQLMKAAEAGVVSLEPEEGAPTEQVAGIPEHTADERAGNEKSDSPVSEASPPAQEVSEPPAQTPTAHPKSNGAPADTADAGNVHHQTEAQAAAPATVDDTVHEGAAERDGVLQEQPPTTASAPDEHGSGMADGAAGDPPSAPMAEAPSMSAALKCYPNDVFVFPSPGTKEETVRHMAELRAGLVGEFDRPAPETAIELARLYILEGMGVEARAVIETFALGHPWAKLHLEMASLVENVAIQEPAVLSTEGCLGEQAIWRAFAQAMSGASEAALKSERTAGRALERMDIALREKIAGRIGLAATTVGDWSVARRMEALAIRSSRSKQKPEPETQLLAARIARWHGEHQKAVAMLEELRNRRGPLSDEALLTFGEMIASGEVAVADHGEGVRLDLGSLAREVKGTPLGTRAFDLEVRLTNQFSGRAQAIDLLSTGSEDGFISPDGFVDRVTSLVTRPGDDDGNRPLALIYLDEPERLAPALEQRAFRQALAMSMAEIGTPGLARPILRDGDLDERAIAEQLAQAFLDADDPREAMDVAGYLPEGPAKRRILSEGLLADGQADRAVAVLEQDRDAEDPEIVIARARAAVASGDWAEAAAALERQLAADPDPAVAGQLALVAMQSGATELPPSAEAVLAEKDPERLQWFQAMFSEFATEELLRSPGAIESVLESLDAETAAIQKMLDDG